ncbi:J domain-containing protein [Hydrogenophaga sp.]|uniref:J domain-containing protein n=1 Tax=Hydrogenophaga sp. TaxID=1904254 RepID=UPI002720BA5B|nr:J domain-containing protein [Hydrogenophaga sp.]MDO9439158.1 J domain-containing protein [Hydrogenophaga sp.]
MSDNTGRDLREWRGLVLALLDFERAPGRYPVALREPRPLFEEIGSVMLLAAGRPVPGLPAPPRHSEPELRRAARYFVRTVMLRPGADFFTLLGLTPGFEPAKLREHYRLMIRLTHPDFSGTGERWPADAAVRVNQAKDLLSSPERQAEYAASLRRQPRGRVLAGAGVPPPPPQRLLMQAAEHGDAAAPPAEPRTSLRDRLTVAASSAVLGASSFLRKVLRP